MDGSARPAPAWRAGWFDVAAALADPREACLAERRNRLRSRDDRKPGTHAAISTEAMIGGSLASGAGTSSK